jgi:hypothetical protein
MGQDTADATPHLLTLMMVRTDLRYIRVDLPGTAEKPHTVGLIRGSPDLAAGAIASRKDTTYVPLYVRRKHAPHCPSSHAGTDVRTVGPRAAGNV